jgi:hypothetical protein
MLVVEAPKVTNTKTHTLPAAANHASVGRCGTGAVEWVAACMSV